MAKIRSRSTHISLEFSFIWVVASKARHRNASKIYTFSSTQDRSFVFADKNLGD